MAILSNLSTELSLISSGNLLANVSPSSVSGTVTVSDISDFREIQIELLIGNTILAVSRVPISVIKTNPLRVGYYGTISVWGQITYSNDTTFTWNTSETAVGTYALNIRGLY